MSRDPAVDFGAFSVIAACLRDRPVDQQSATLVGLGLERSWPGIQSQWAHVLLDDMGRGDLTRVEHFIHACAHERARRAEGDEIVAALSMGQPVTPEMVHFADPTPRPVTRVGIPAPPGPINVAVDRGPPSVTMECEPAEHPDENEPQIEGPGTLDFRPQPPREEHTTLIPAKPQRLTARSVADPLLEATRRAARWSVDRYAAFAAALSLRPDAHPTVCRDFDVPTEALETIHRAWKRKLEPDPALRASYLAHYEASLQHLKPTS